MPALLALLLTAAPLHPAEEVVPRAIAAEDAPVALRFGWKPGLALAVEVELVRTENEDGDERVLRRRATYDLEVRKVGEALEVRAIRYRELEAPSPSVDQDGFLTLPAFGRPPVVLAPGGTLLIVDPSDPVVARGLVSVHGMLIGRWLGESWRVGAPVDRTGEADWADGDAAKVPTRASLELAARVPCEPGKAARCVRLVHAQRADLPAAARALSKTVRASVPPDVSLDVSAERLERAGALVTDPDTLVPVALEERADQVFRAVVGGQASRMEVHETLRMTFRRR